MITQDTKQPIMEVKDLIREFPAGDEKIRVLHGIDLTIYEGEMVAIIGQSGSGKSTLMNILGCLDQATAGSYHIYGKAVDKLSADELAEFKKLAALYSRQPDSIFAAGMKQGSLLEICHAETSEI